MNHPAFVKIDKETFFRLVAEAPDNVRYEYVRGRIVQQQAGGTLRHARIGSRFLSTLQDRLDASRWIAVPERGIETAVTIRYADVSVEPASADPDSLATASPVLIVEVLSPTSSDRDLNEKPFEYLNLPTLHAYIIASQTEPACLVWVRDEAGEFLLEPAELRGLSEIIAVPALALVIPLADIYRDVV